MSKFKSAIVGQKVKSKHTKYIYLVTGLSADRTRIEINGSWIQLDMFQRNYKLKQQKLFTEEG